MKNTYKFKFSPLICVLAAIINILFLTVIVLNSMKLAGAATLNTANPALDISALIVSVVLIIFVDLLMFASSYTVKDDYLLYVLGVIFLKIKYDDIIVIRQEKNTEALVVNYKKTEKNKNGEEKVFVNGLVINIPNSKKDDFVKNIRSKNKSIKYEIIDMKLDEKDGVNM